MYEKFFTERRLQKYAFSVSKYFGVDDETPVIFDFYFTVFHRIQNVNCIGLEQSSVGLAQRGLKFLTWAPKCCHKVRIFFF